MLLWCPLFGQLNWNHITQLSHQNSFGHWVLFVDIYKTWYTGKMQLFLTMAEESAKWHSWKTFRPRKNGWHYADDIFKSIFSNIDFWISNKILILWVLLTICHHWFKQLLGAEQVTSHYLNQWWHSLLMHGYVHSLDEFTCCGKT